jgi:tartrate dehydratase beta subunit/fumarate hydratase class I family protein
MAYSLSIRISIMLSFLMLEFTSIHAQEKISDAKSQWEKVSSPGVKLMMKSNKLDDTFISLMEDNGEYDLKVFDSAAYLKGLPEAREVIYKIMGISDYLITNSNVIKLPNSIQIDFQGTNLKKSKVKMYFCESHIFEKNIFR